MFFNGICCVPGAAVYPALTLPPVSPWLVNWGHCRFTGEPGCWFSEDCARTHCQGSQQPHPDVCRQCQGGFSLFGSVKLFLQLHQLLDVLDLEILSLLSSFFQGFYTWLLFHLKELVPFWHSWDVDLLPPTDTAWLYASQEFFQNELQRAGPCCLQWLFVVVIIIVGCRIGCLKMWTLLIILYLCVAAGNSV